MITIDGNSEASLNVKLLSDYSDPGTPRVRKQHVDVPGRAGVYDFNTEYDVRPIELSFVTTGTTSPTNVQAVIRNFVDVLTDTNGDPKEVTLTFSEESSKHYDVKLDSIINVTRTPAGFAKFRVRFLARTPFAFSDTSTVTTNVTSSGQTISVTNSGSAATPTVITITNNGDNAISGFTIQKSS